MLHNPGHFTTETLRNEYKFCHDKATSLERNVYTFSAIFGIGSIPLYAGVLIAIENFKNVVDSNALMFSVFIISLIAIGGWYTWLRLADRWLSVVYIMILRMEDIDRSIGFKLNLYVRYNDDKHHDVYRNKFDSKFRNLIRPWKWINMTNQNQKYRGREVEFSTRLGRHVETLKKPYLDEFLLERLNYPILNFEPKSIRYMLKFFSKINIAAWFILVFVVLSDSFEVSSIIFSNDVYRLVVAGTLISFIYFLLSSSGEK